MEFMPKPDFLAFDHVETNVRQERVEPGPFDIQAMRARGATEFEIRIAISERIVVREIQDWCIYYTASPSDAVQAYNMTRVVFEDTIDIKGTKVKLACVPVHVEGMKKSIHLTCKLCGEATLLPT